jgi:hypothetical protein
MRDPGGAANLWDWKERGFTDLSQFGETGVLENRRPRNRSNSASVTGSEK